MRHPIRLGLLAASALFSACAHDAYGPSSDDRLASEVNENAELTAPRPAGEIQGCQDLTEQLARARNPGRSEVARLGSYMRLYHTLTVRLAANQRLFDREPDLVYGGGKGQAAADQARAEQEQCQRMSADARSELELFVRDLFQPLIITDLASGRRVARVSFILLRSAIKELELADAPALLQRIAAAERIVRKR